MRLYEHSVTYEDNMDDEVMDEPEDMDEDADEGVEDYFGMSPDWYAQACFFCFSTMNSHHCFCLRCSSPGKMGLKPTLSHRLLSSSLL